MTPETSIQLLY